MPTEQVPIIHSVFGGMKPRVSPYLLGSESAQEAVDCDFLSGALRPLKSRHLVPDIDMGTKKAIIIASDGKFIPVNSETTWVHRQATIDGDVVKRIIHTGNGSPQYLVEGTDDHYPFASLPKLHEVWEANDQGGPTGMSAAVTAGVTSANDTRYYYAIAIANRFGDESELSLSVTAQAPANGRIVVAVTATAADELRTALDGHDTAGMQVRLYRSSLGQFLLIKEEALSLTVGEAITFTDFFDSTQLVPDGSDTSISQPTRLRTYASETTNIDASAKDFIEHPNGFLACHNGQEVMFSDPLNLGLFPISTRIAFGDEIVGIREHLNRIIVFLRDREHQVINLSLPTTRTVASPEISYPCLPDSVFGKVASGIIYPCPDGLAITSGYETQLLTADHFDEVSFRQLLRQGGSPKLRIAGGDDDFIVWEEGLDAYLFQRMAHMTKLSDGILSAQYFEGSWYFVVEGPDSNHLYNAFGGRDSRTLKWSSGYRTLPRPTTLRGAAVLGDYSSRTFSDVAGLGANPPLGEAESIGHYEPVRAETSRASLAVMSIGQRSWDSRTTYPVGTIRGSRPFNLRSNTQILSYNIEVETNANIFQVVLGSSQRALATVMHPQQ